MALPVTCVPLPQSNLTRPEISPGRAGQLFRWSCLTLPSAAGLADRRRAHRRRHGVARSAAIFQNACCSRGMVEHDLTLFSGISKLALAHHGSFDPVEGSLERHDKISRMFDDCGLRPLNALRRRAPRGIIDLCGRWECLFLTAGAIGYVLTPGRRRRCARPASDRR